MSQTVIAFQEDCILTAAGREGKYPTITEAERFDLQGQGDSFDRWRQALERLAARQKPEKVRLVLPAGLCVTRVLQLPGSRGKRFSEMAATFVGASGNPITAVHGRLRILPADRLLSDFLFFSG